MENKVVIIDCQRGFVFIKSNFLSLVFRYMIPVLWVLSAAVLSTSARATDPSPKAQTLLSPDSAQLKTLIELCDSFRITNSPYLDYYLIKLGSAAAKIQDPALQAEACCTMGDCYSEKDFAKATLYYEKSLSLYKTVAGRTGEEGYASATYSYGLIFHYNGDFETALKMYLDAEMVFTKYHNYRKLAVTYMKLADIYDKLGQTGKRTSYVKKAIEFALRSNDPLLLGKAYINQGIINIYDKNFKEASLYCTKALNAAIAHNDRMLQHVVYYNMGFLESQQEHYARALEYYTRSYVVAKEYNSVNAECDALYKIGLTQYYMQNYANADKTLSEAMTMAKNMKSKLLIRNILDAQYSLEQSTNHYKKANAYLNQYIDVSFEMFSDEGQHQVNFLNAKYEAQKRENQIRQLENDKKIRDLMITKRQQWILGLTTISVLLIVIILYAHFNYRNKKKIAEQKIALKEQKISEMEKHHQLLATQSVLQGEETERSRLARDLHDGLGGLLSGIKLTLSNMKGDVMLAPAGMTQFNQALALLDSSIVELRRVAHNMMPETLVRFGLKDALHDFCAGITNVGVSFQFFGEKKRVDNKIEISMYRIGQELINNALKHARAKQILVQLVQETNRIHLTVQDDGEGFDPVILHTSKGAGLANIRSRAESLNAHFDIWSEPGKGTEASVELTLPANG